jgi:hypothetical protein
MSLERTPNGKILLVVKNAPESLRPVLDGLGIFADDMTNRRSILCSNAAELDAARNPLRSYFDAQGNLINQ